MWEGEGGGRPEREIEIHETGFISRCKTSMATLISGIPETLTRLHVRRKAASHEFRGSAWSRGTSLHCDSHTALPRTDLLVRAHSAILNGLKLREIQPSWTIYLPLRCFLLTKRKVSSLREIVQHLTASRHLQFITRCTPGCKHSHMTTQMMLSNRNLSFFKSTCEIELTANLFCTPSTKKKKRLIPKPFDHVKYPSDVLLFKEIWKS